MTALLVIWGSKELVINAVVLTPPFLYISDFLPLEKIMRLCSVCVRERRMRAHYWCAHKHRLL